VGLEEINRADICGEPAPYQMDNVGECFSRTSTVRDEAADLLERPEHGSFRSLGWCDLRPAHVPPPVRAVNELGSRLAAYSTTVQMRTLTSARTLPCCRGWPGRCWRALHTRDRQKRRPSREPWTKLSEMSGPAGQQAPREFTAEPIGPGPLRPPA